MPDHATIDGKPIHPGPQPGFNARVDFEPEQEPQTVYGLGERVVGYTRPPSMSDIINTANAFKVSYQQCQRVNAANEVVPTLVSIGLLDALLEVEGVLAWNSTEKHPGAKWKAKSISYHDAKGVGHLSKAQCGELVDSETQCRHRAHSICRLLMSLQHELNNDT